MEVLQGLGQEHIHAQSGQALVQHRFFAVNFEALR
jgi:hypothetical protein